ncbi:MAG TPA: tetratricopeptide repeat protein [Candidatus Acidoferrales bacterium]|nr:tetratricopeptide repeat protein [Candidatus Acidoferrales bacterium]
MRALNFTKCLGAASACLLILTALAQANESGPRPIGAGAFPVSFTLASAWFADHADAKRKNVTLLVYFEGTAGWQHQPTKFNWVVNQSPANIQMSVGKTEILVRYWSDSGDVEIQGTKVNLSGGNVFLVRGIDSAKPLVKALGTQDLSFSVDENPPVALLKRSPDVWAALSGKPASEHSKSRSPSASAEVVAWDTEGLRLLLTENPDSQHKACELFRQAALKGYAGSQYRMGYCYQTGKGVEQNFTTANEWYEKAGNQGFVDAQYKLGHSYRVGRGTPIDLATALEWYKKAANNGDGEAMQNVGWMYATGQGTKADAGEAYHWLLEAAKHGQTGAQFEVARRLKDGDGVTKNLTDSYGWLLVLLAQEKNFQPDSLTQIKEMVKSMESQLDKPAKEKAQVQCQDLLTTISRNDLDGLARP